MCVREKVRVCVREIVSVCERESERASVCGTRGAHSSPFQYSAVWFVIWFRRLGFRVQELGFRAQG